MDSTQAQEIEVIADRLESIGLPELASMVRDRNRFDKLKLLQSIAENPPSDADSCGFCGAYVQSIHNKDCRVLEAWRLSNHPSYNAYLDSCRESAHTIQARRMTPQRSIGLESMNKYFKKIYTPQITSLLRNE